MAVLIDDTAFLEDRPREEHLRALDRADGEESLYAFIRLMWHAVEPETPFVGGWALEAICKHLEAVTSGEITRLLINVPPGSTKSLATSVFYPAWEWGPKNRAALRYMCCAYGQHLTARDNRRFRSVVTSKLYRELWGDRFALTGEATELVSNTRMGWKLASSVGGVGTGERADRLILDDPNRPPTDLDIGESSAIMNSTATWFREVMPDRLNSLERSAIVVIQQRLDERDVSGTITELGLAPLAENWQPGDYVHLSVPFDYDPLRHCVTVLGWQDPRGVDEDGEMLPAIDLDARGNAFVVSGSPLADKVGCPVWPERYGEGRSLQQLRELKGSLVWSGQYNQIPVPRGGNIIKNEWWQLWAEDEYPEYGTCVASLDTAIKEQEENDYTALTVWGAFAHPETLKPALMMRDAWRARIPLGEMVRRVIRSCREHKVEKLLIEDATRGTDVRDEIYRLIGGREIRLELIPPRGDKVARLNACVPIFESGIIFAPEKDWSDMVIREVSAFPRGRHDDLTDTVAMALLYLRATGVAVRREEHEEEVTARMMYRKKPRPLYDV